MNKIRLAVVDDQTLVREGLASLLSMVPDLEIVGTASNGQSAINLVAEKKPEVLLMDIQMPGMNGVAATREISARFPGTRVIVLTTFKNDEYVFEALKAGAVGYLLKNADPDQLAKAIRAVYAGDAVLDPVVTSKIIHMATGGNRSSPFLAEKLTAREHDVLTWIAEGFSNAEIAEELFLAEGTVKNHVTHILAKMGARDRAHAIRLTIEWGLLND